MKNSMLLVALFLSGCASSYNAYSFSDAVVITNPMMEDTINPTERAFILSHEVCHNVLGHTESMGRSSQKELNADICAFKILRDNKHDVCLAVKFMERITEHRLKATISKKRKEYWKKELKCS